jgi:hypothetical protein
MVIYGPSIDVSECPTYCTLDSDGNFMEDDSSEEEEETVQIPTPRSIRAARRNRRTMSSVIIGMLTFMTCMVPAESSLSMTAHQHSASVFAAEVLPVTYLLLAAGALALTIFMLQRQERLRYRFESHEVFDLRMRLNRTPTAREIAAELQRLEILRWTREHGHSPVSSSEFSPVTPDAPDASDDEQAGSVLPLRPTVHAGSRTCWTSSRGNPANADRVTVQIPTPRSVRAARRSALPIALMFLLTMAIPGDAAIVQNGTVLILQPAIYGSVLTGAEWNQLMRDFHADFYYYRSVGRIALIAPLLLLFAAVAVAAMRLYRAAAAPSSHITTTPRMAQQKRKKYGPKNLSHYRRKGLLHAHTGADGTPKRKIYGPAIWSKGMALCSNVINGVRCNQEHLRRLCPPTFGPFQLGPFLPTTTPTDCPAPGPAPVSCKPPLDYDPNFDYADACYKIFEAADL